MNIIQKNKFYLMLIVGALFFSSCASILNSKFQKITINTGENSEVLIDGRVPDKTDDGRYLVRRDAKSKQITVKKDGYKDENISIVQYRRSPFYAMSIVPFAITIFPPFYDNMIRSRNYLNEISVEQVIEIPSNGFSSVLRLNDITVIPNDDKTHSRHYIQYRKFVRNKSLDNEHKGKLSVSPSVIKTNLIELFEEKRYITYENNDLKKIYLNATITSCSYNSFGFYTSGNTATQDDFGEMLYVNMNIKWEVLDSDKKIFFTYQTKNRSGQFAFYDKKTQINAISMAEKDAIEIAFLKLVKTDDFTKQLNKRSSEIKTYLADISTKQRDSVFVEIQEGEDVISLVNKAGILYLARKNLELRATYRGSGAVKKQAFLQMVEDVPELHSYAEKNINLGRTAFATSLIECYNDYVLSGKKNELNQSYYYKFGLISKKEYHKGPSEEMLRVKKPITGRITKITTTTNHYTNSGLTSSTTGENFRLKFMYGNAQYKSGFLLKNLKKAMGQDKEAIKHIGKYRANWAARTGIFFVGVLQAGLAINWAASEKSPFGLSTVGGIIAVAPGIIFINWFNLFPQKYKSKNITNAINTYNGNLK
jgi:hypothetical protein